MNSSVTLMGSRCATCEVSIVGRPVFRAGVPFCCAGCAAGGPCTCSYDTDASPDTTGHEAPTPVDVRYCLDVRAMVATPEAVSPRSGGTRPRILGTE